MEKKLQLIRLLAQGIYLVIDENKDSFKQQGKIIQDHIVIIDCACKIEQLVNEIQADQDKAK